MMLIIGLGNPGKKYQKTRHNLGFRAIDEFRKENNFPKFQSSKKFNSLISGDRFNKEKIIIAKPQTFMNDSGKAVKLIIDYLSLIAENLWIVHDDIDLPLGKFKISKGRGAAGHKGVQSIIDELGTKNFVRFRIGIKPQPCALTPKTLNRFVLQKFSKEEEKIIKEVIKKTTEAIEFSLKEDLEKAIQKFNK